MFGLDAAAGGHLLRDSARFSHTVFQGNYSEGWRLPLAYLWYAEHAIAFLWALALIFAVWKLVRGERAEVFVVGVAGFGSIYAGMVVMSVGLERMVVYGRQVRQLVPFACMVSAAVLARAWTASPRGRAAVAAVLAGVVVQAGGELLSAADAGVSAGIQTSRSADRRRSRRPDPPALRRAHLSRSRSRAPGRPDPPGAAPSSSISALSVRGVHARGARGSSRRGHPDATRPRRPGRGGGSQPKVRRSAR